VILVVQRAADAIVINAVIDDLDVTGIDVWAMVITVSTARTQDTITVEVDAHWVSLKYCLA